MQGKSKACYSSSGLASQSTVVSWHTHKEGFYFKNTLLLCVLRKNGATQALVAE